MDKTAVTTPLEVAAEEENSAVLSKRSQIRKKNPLFGAFQIAWCYLKVGSRWTPDQANESFVRRDYRDYDEYVEHQRSKLGRLDLSDYDRDYRLALRTRLDNLGVVNRGMSVLCLAARIGTEVKAFIDHGAFAIGIDLNPGPDNRYVVNGDFHDLQYAPASVDLIFSNSIDHVYDLPKLIGQMKQVLKPGGALLLEVGHGTEKDESPNFYESFYWKHVDDLVATFASHGFQLQQRTNFEFPWPGEQLLLRSQK